MTIDDLKPRLLWHYFKALTQIPRPSYHEEAVRQYVLDEAGRLGLSAEMDDVGNIVVRKPATPGNERAAGVILQSHLDMVPQKNNDKQHDFAKDPITTLVEGEWLTADGTTLGADNGIGAAAALAVLAADDIAHGPIEALFTATEESGMEGAKGLRCDWLAGKILLNLDSEDDGELYIGCAGGVDATMTVPAHKQSSPSGKTLTLKLSGLAGGHSGLNIIDQRGNANILLAQLLAALCDETEIHVASLHGGNLRNAIPREAQANIVYSGDVADLYALLDKHSARLRAGLGACDQGFNVACFPAEQDAEAVLSASVLQTLLTAILLFPNGVVRMSHAMPGLVETSSNLAVVRCTPNEIVLEALQRSSSDDALAALKYRTALLASALGGSVTFSGEYSGWQPQPEAGIVRLMQETGEEVFGRKPPLKGIHAGLECGILGERYPHWEMVSFGPTITGAHSPDERVFIPSVATFWQWLTLALSRIGQSENGQSNDN